MKCLFFILPLFLFLCTENKINAQQYTSQFQHYGQEEGLPSENAYIVFKDHQGFLWVGTDIGASRFDGYKFKTYTLNNSNLRVANIQNILEDNAGNIWLINGKDPALMALGMNIDVLSVQEDKIYSFDVFFKQQRPFEESDIEFISGWDRVIWVKLKNEEYYRFDGQWHHLTEATTYNGLVVAASDSTKQWIGDRPNRLVELDNKGRILGEEKIKLSTHFIIVDKKDKIWWVPGNLQLDMDGVPYGKHNYSLFFKEKGGPVEEYNLKEIGNNHAYNVIVSRKDDFIYLVGKNDIHLFHKEKGWLHHITNIQTNNASPNFLLRLDVMDDNNALWLSSTDGIWQINFTRSPFKSTLTGYSIRGITEDNNGDIFVGTDQSSTIFKWQKNKATLEKMTNESFNSPFGVSSIGQHLWIGDHSGNIISWQTDQRTFQTYALRAKDHLGYFVCDVITFHKGLKDRKIWAGTMLGLFNIDTNNKQTIPFLQKEMGETPYLNCFYENEKGVWTGSQKGVFLWTAEDGLIKHYSKKTGDLPHDNVLGICEDQEVAGQFWLATRGGGLVKWQPDQQEFKSFGRKEGLADDVIYAIDEDAHGFLWLPSNNGVMRFDKKKEEMVNHYLPEDNSWHPEFNFPSRLKGKDGRLHYGGQSGLISFHPDDFLNPSNNPLLKASSFKVLNSETGEFEDRIAAFNQQPSIKLSPNEKSFILEVTLMDFIKVKENRYAYKLEGFEKNWNFLSTNEIRINGLPYGDYVLKVKGMGAGRNWSSNELEIPVKVLKPIYLQTWFLALMAIGLFLSFFAFLNWRTIQLRQRQLQLETEVAQQTQQIRTDKTIIENQRNSLSQSLQEKEVLLKEIHHRVKNNLQIISNLMAKQSRKTTDETVKKMMQEGQDRVQSMALIHQNLYQSDTLSGIDVKAYLEELTQNIARTQTVSGKEITVKLDVDDSKLDIDTAIPIGLILNELITNSFKYAFPERNAGKISIGFKKMANQKFSLVVKDNGVGIANDFNIRKAKSLGLNLVQGLVIQLDGSMELNGSSKGTQFELVF